MANAGPVINLSFTLKFCNYMEFLSLQMGPHLDRYFQMFARKQTGSKYENNLEKSKETLLPRIWLWGSCPVEHSQRVVIKGEGDSCKVDLSTSEQPEPPSFFSPSRHTPSFCKMKSCICCKRILDRCRDKMFCFSAHSNPQLVHRLAASIC